MHTYKKEGFGKRRVCSALCDIGSQEEQMVNFSANSEQRKPWKRLLQDALLS